MAILVGQDVFFFTHTFPHFCFSSHFSSSTLRKAPVLHPYNDFTNWLNFVNDAFVASSREYEQYLAKILDFVIWSTWVQIWPQPPINMCL